jgi:hypothetical protein
MSNNKGDLGSPFTSSRNTFEDKYTSNESKSTIRNQSIDNTDLIKNLGRSVKKTSRCFFPIIISFGIRPIVAKFNPKYLSLYRPVIKNM